MNAPDADRPARLRELVALFLKLGVLAFGGPAAHIAMMRHEIVERRRWLDDRRFLDLLAAANVIPGPTSTELAIHIGFERGRWPGLWIAGAAFIVPAMLITAACGWLYVEYGTLPAVGGVLTGVKPVMVVIVLQAVWKLLPAAARTWPQRVLGAVALALLFAFDIDELLVLFGGGLCRMLASGAAGRGTHAGAIAALWPATTPNAVGAGVAGIAAAATAATPSGLFLVFAKIGSVLFGSGYVLLVFLQSELVERHGWLTEAQVLDAIAVGQVTPGPVFTTATFVGYVLAGPLGACAATAGIFLPAFLFVALIGPLVPRLRKHALTGAFLDGVTVTSLALMIDVSVEVGRSAVVDFWMAAILLVAGVLLLRYRVNPTWLILGGGLAGLALRVGGLA